MSRRVQKTDILNIEPAYDNGDAFYAALIEAVDAVGDDAAPAFLARLTLILSNQIGRVEVLKEAIAAARADIRSK